MPLPVLSRAWDFFLHLIYLPLLALADNELVIAFNVFSWNFLGPSIHVEYNIMGTCHYRSFMFSL